MAEYIDRQAAIEIASGYCHPANIAAELAKLPAADVRPVKRGKWINDHNGKYSSSGDNYFCSACKDPSLRAFGKPARTNYCPNCGAEMEA